MSENRMAESTEDMLRSSSSSSESGFWDFKKDPSAATAPRRLPSSRPRGTPTSAKPASKPDCKNASLPAMMPSR